MRHPTQGAAVVAWRESYARGTALLVTLGVCSLGSRSPLTPENSLIGSRRFPVQLGPQIDYWRRNSGKMSLLQR